MKTENVFFVTAYEILVTSYCLDARDKMDAMLSSETAWLPLIGGEGDDLKITEVGEAFLTLVSTITDRYSMLPQPGHRYE